MKGIPGDEEQVKVLEYPSPITVTLGLAPALAEPGVYYNIGTGHCISPSDQAQMFMFELSFHYLHSLMQPYAQQFQKYSL